MNYEPIHVLVIEDDPIQAKYIQGMFSSVEAEAFVITIGNSLKAGIDIIASARVDIILLDLMLPDSQGLETFIKMYDHAPTIPIVVLSSLDDETPAVLAVQRGAQDYLIKGKIDVHTLVRSIRYSIERKNTELALRESERRYKELVDSLPITIFETDKRGNITFLNQEAHKKFGYTRYDLEKGINILQLIHPDDRSRAKMNFQQSIKDRNSDGLQYKAIRTDQRTIPVVIYSTPILDAQHSNKGLRGVVVDLSKLPPPR